MTGLNTKDFAALIGVSPKTINNAEGDQHSVRPIVLNAWALATGVPVEWLETGIGGHGGGPPPGRADDSLQRLTETKRRRARTVQPRDTRRYLPAAVYAGLVTTAA